MMKTLRTYGEHQANAWQPLNDAPEAAAAAPIKSASDLLIGLGVSDPDRLARAGRTFAEAPAPASQRTRSHRSESAAALARQARVRADALSRKQPASSADKSRKARGEFAQAIDTTSTATALQSPELVAMLRAMGVTSADFEKHGPRVLARRRQEGA